jgi:2-polyprenyl-6-methoxyphenol hydroxylase-like FAD-dependent oxidoreductase
LFFFGWGGGGPPPGGSGASGAETNAGIGVSTIWACETGWWYSAPLPQQQRILAFYTDADLPVAKHVRDAGGLLATARAHPPLSGLDPAFPLQAWLAALTENGFSFGFTAANSAQTCPPVGPGWLCAGDAALSFDPLSAQGIFNALYTGLAAAESIYRYLQNDIHDFSEYAAHLQQIRASYQQHLRQWYGAEQRWADAPFWQRRHMGN